MESPDVVDTSDVEEREILSFSDVVTPWTTSASAPPKSVRANILASPLAQSVITEKRGYPGSPPALLMRRNQLSDYEVEDPSPRKRAKVVHNAGSVPPGSAHSPIVEASVLNSVLLQLAPVERTPDLPSRHSGERMPAGDGEGHPPVLFAPRDASPPSDHNSLFSSPHRLEYDPSTSRGRSQSVDSRSISQPLSPSHSRSISSDHHSLFSSPRHPATPLPTSQRSHDHLNSARRSWYSVTSSPLTPILSPALLSHTPSRSPDPIIQPPSLRLRFPYNSPASLSPDPIQLRPHVPHSLTPQTTPPQAIPRSAPSPSVEVLEDLQSLSRYSLRRREARQLNPYAYDRLLYKQQLKSHPDAIVKFRSPRRRPEHDGVIDGGTQDEFIFFLDNPDQDGDYVDAVGAESGGRRKRSVAQSLERNSESGGVEKGLDAGQTGKGWLPQTLKGLSSSDEDDNEIRKLARKVRREREKAEAAARAEARRAAAEARRVETETKKLAKRPKPFPIRGDVGVEIARLAEHISPVASSPSSPLFSRANSDSMMVLSPSAPRSPLGPPAPSRVSPSPPTSSPGSHRSPNFGVYLPQDDPYQFSDQGYGASLSRDHSPVDQSITYSAPSSPSAPPTTSGASALPSNTSGMDSESDQPSAFEMNSKDRKRLRALRRMMPAAMITRQLEGSKMVHHPPPRVRAAAESSGSEAEEVRTIPGVARVRKGRYRNAEVRGDPESSDAEHPAEVYDSDGREDARPGAVEVFSDGQSSVKVRRLRRASPKVRHEDDVISLSDSSIPGISSEDSGTSSSRDEKTHQSLFYRPPRAPAREKSLIDWMLTRTRNSGRQKSKSKQPTKQRRSRGSGTPRLNIVTSGARRYGDHHQTLLPFIRANAGSSATSSVKHSSPHQDRTVQFDQDAAEERKKWKKKRLQSGSNQGLIYNVHHDATRITSKHRERKGGRRKTALVIKNNDSEVRQALDPGWRAEVERWNKPVSPARQPAAKLALDSPVVPRPRLYRQTPRPQQEIPLPSYFQREEEPFSPTHRHIDIDMNITPLPLGVKFGSSSYIGRGHLYQLVLIASGNSEVTQPMSCNIQGLEIGPTTSAAVFGELLGPLFDLLVSALREFRADNIDTMKEWESMTRASSRLLSWLAVHAEDQDFATLEVAIQEYSDGLLVVLDSLGTTLLTLTAHWFVVELAARLATGAKYRRGSAESRHLIRSARQLMQHLLDIDLRTAFATLRAAEADVDDASLHLRAVELWICLIHLLPNFEIFPEATPGHPLWRLLVNLYPESSPTGAEASEDMWRMIFSLCAVSQFSVHGLSTSVFRLPAGWELVAAALKKIVLTASPEKERQLPLRALRKRDEYVSYVVSRCFLLWNRWEWRLDDGVAMFKSLHEIFRSRNFANLLNERSVPMGFLEHGDLELLSKQDPHDSVFEVFLKMVVQAVHLSNANTEPDPKQRSVNIKKLLQMAVPVSPVPFSRSAPPSAHTLSMLVNRFSAIAVAIHLDPTSSNVKFRIAQARRCVSFIDADDQSRVACIYGMMNFGMIIRHHKVACGLEEALGWLGEMTDVLMDEYKEGEADEVKRKTITTLIQLLIGSVRRVIETQSLDKGESRAEYPDPALLDGPWVTRVFNPRTDLITIQQTGVEIRMLVQSFLNFRLKALPDVQPPPPCVVHSVESQESQDEYDKLFLDLNDEELLAALGEEAETSAIADLKLKEDTLCRVLDKYIAPAVYRLVCKHFSEDEVAKSDMVSTKAADEWIDCWVGCANVLVQNNYKDWGLYMKLGQQSWEKIIDESWRRRVGLRFNLTLLRLDPGAYNKMKDDFIAVLLVAMLSYKTTIEHEFVSEVLSLDRLRHPLLRDTPLEPIPGTRKYEVSLADYETIRGRLIETVFANTARCFRTKVDAESQAYVELVVMMLSTMRDIYQELRDEKEIYGVFCRAAFHALLSHPELSLHPRMSGALAWGRREWNV